MKCIVTCVEGDVEEGRIVPQQPADKLYKQKMMKKFNNVYSMQERAFTESVGTEVVAEIIV